MSETVDKKNLLTSKEVNRAWLLWLFNNQACYNYERMMGIGFLHAMTPAFRKLYKDNKDLRIECSVIPASLIVSLVWGHLLLDWFWRWKNRRHWELNLIMMQSPQLKPD